MSNFIPLQGAPPMLEKNISEKTIISRIANVSIIGNIILTVFKLIAGIFGHSTAMLSD